MTDHITISRALLEQAMNALLLPCDRWNKQQFKIVTAAAEAIRAELAKPVEQVEPVAWIYGIPGHKNAASCERIPLDMCPRGTTEAPLYLHPPTPAWHDAPEVAALKAERDAAMKDAERMKEGLDAVEVLIDNSSGVAGLHLNGDLALWSDLRTGGHFEAWLLAFDEAIDAAMKGTP